MPAKISSRPGSGFARRAGFGAAAFSLVELMVVIGLIAALLALAAPSLMNLGPSRKSAAVELSGFLERARSRALAEQRIVFVAFADGNHPIETARFRACAAFVGDSDSTDPLATLPVNQATEWFELPEGIFFAKARYFEADPRDELRTLIDLPHRRSFPVRKASGGSVPARLPYVAFAPHGGILLPSLADADGLHLGVVEGILEDSGRAIRAVGESQEEVGRGELLRLSYYTGRARILTD